MNVYQPYATRGSARELVHREREKALAIDPQNANALIAQYIVSPSFGSFAELDETIERVRRVEGGNDAKTFLGFCSRAMGRMRESLELTELAYSLDALNPMSANAVALARMAVGQFDGVVSVLEDLMAREPNMSFAVANLLRAYAFLGDWAAVDRLLDPAAKRPLREYEDGLLFIRTKRSPTAENLGEMRTALEARFKKTGGVEVSQLVYAAHVGLVDDVYRIAETARLGPRGADDDVMGPDAYRTGLLFWQGMPEIRNDPRFVPLCARLGLVEFWLTTQKWPDCVDDVPYDFKAACEKARDIPKQAFGF